MARDSSPRGAAVLIGALAARAALMIAGARRHEAEALDARFGGQGAWWPHRQRLGSVLRRPALLERLAASELEDLAQRALAEAEALGYRIIEGGDLGALDQLPEPPLALFGAGELPGGSEGCVAIVGSRRASGYGLRMAHRIAAGLAEAGVWVISGLARGIDAAAHRGALEGGGRTLAVLGSGPGRPYPPEHRDLLLQIEREGGALTEHPPGAPPLPHHFPRRNRILVGLADAVLVIEARLKSGTLTSVRWAADLGREVLVLPGAVDHAGGEGPLELLREGATPVGTVEQVLEALGWGARAAAQENAESEGELLDELVGLEGRLAALLGAGPLGLDELVRLSLEPPSQVHTALLALEARGVLAREADQRYRVAYQSGGRDISQPNRK